MSCWKEGLKNDRGSNKGAASGFLGKVRQASEEEAELSSEGCTMADELIGGWGR